MAKKWPRVKSASALRTVRIANSTYVPLSSCLLYWHLKSAEYSDLVRKLSHPNYTQYGDFELCHKIGRTSNVRILDLRMAPACYYLTAQWTQINKKFPAFEKIPSDWYLGDGSFKPLRSNLSQGFTKIQFDILFCAPLLNFTIISNMWRYQIMNLKTKNLKLKIEILPNNRYPIAKDQPLQYGLRWMESRSQSRRLL